MKKMDSVLNGVGNLTIDQTALPLPLDIGSGTVMRGMLMSTIVTVLRRSMGKTYTMNLVSKLEIILVIIAQFGQGWEK
jgi:hypothetical protein